MIINVYDDGKLARARKATIIKHGSKRVLIRYYSWMQEEEVTHWFRRVRKDQGGAYTSVVHNEWYYPFRETPLFKQHMKSHFVPELFEKLFSHIPDES